MKEITGYFRNSLIAQNNIMLDFKKGYFETVPEINLINGQIDATVVAKLFAEYNKEKKDNSGYLSAIVALKTIATKVVDMQNEVNYVDELTAVFYLSLDVSKDGKLSFSSDSKLPWFPREYLSPNVDAEILIGNADDYDTFISENIDEKYRISSWTDYLTYAKRMYEYVTKTSFNELKLNNQLSTKLNGKIYIFLDTTVNASFHIVNLYNELLKEVPPLPLYEKLLNKQLEKRRQLIPNTDTEKMKRHCGQMGGEYPLSASQREALNHFNELESGAILAVNGPPGTGKTTLLQSVVADMFTRHALEKKKPPIIIASSTNNQAVTNIIDSFGKINKIRIDNLETRWITGIHSFSSYFPSKSKVGDIKGKNYQYITREQGDFMNSIDTTPNIASSEKTMLDECSKYFNIHFDDINKCKDAIHQQLTDIESKKAELIDVFMEIKAIIGDKSISEYIKGLTDHIKGLTDALAKIDLQISEFENRKNELKENREAHCLRMKEWEELYKSLPWYIRLFTFLPFAKRKIYNWVCVNKNTNEVTLLIGDLLLDEIHEKYRQLITSLDQEQVELSKQIDSFEKSRKTICVKRLKIDNTLKLFRDAIGVFLKYNMDNLSKNIKNGCAKCTEIIYNGCIDDWNSLIDSTVRYVEFWLAVHYYECRWILKEDVLSDKQKPTNYEGVLRKFYNRLAMVTPCIVMTLFMLPKQFQTYNQNDKKNSYMYNFIDLLIVDEAGQTSPEIAAPSFALAKRAIVVGDEHQIPPVWGTNNALDITMAIKHEVIPSPSEFSVLTKNGLNTSQSSIMKVASNSCAYNKYDRGLFLCEHRRCYNEIIGYCNKLIYGGNLQPLRGNACDDINSPIKDFLPQMGYKDIPVSTSSKRKSSRYNEIEASEIINWLVENYDIVVQKYKSVDCNVNEKEIFGIITPFKAQAETIKKFLKRASNLNSTNISVGTVHTFQGAERKVIILSTTYGYVDGCSFIDNNPSLMNVAVSRAKDSFLVFGSRNCLSESKESASGLLKEYCKTPIQT